MSRVMLSVSGATASSKVGLAGINQKEQGPRRREGALSEDRTP
jgi:hypothetical protein